jgi:hypothetical protein
VIFSNSPQSRLRLISRLKTAKCDVQYETREQWLTEGDFDTPTFHPDLPNFPNLAQVDAGTIPQRAPRSSLFLLFTRIYREKPDREDLRDVFTISMTFRSDYLHPIGVELTGWTPPAAQADTFALLKIRGLRLELEELVSQEHYERSGVDHLVVHPNQVFRAMLDVRFLVANQDPILACSGRIGMLELAVDRSRLSFALLVETP